MKEKYKDIEINDESRNFIVNEFHTLEQLSVYESTSNELIYKNIINPFTQLPYDGILLYGVFAEMDLLNNNNRYYNEQNYIPFVEQLRKQIWDKRGVYSCLEHPESYSTDTREIAAKLIDIWYNKEDKKVYGICMLLNTPNGLKAQEIYKSGGSLGISARAGGKEHKNTDGTINSEINLLITYDLVYHPGFTNAIMDSKIDINKLKLNDGFLQLNESQQIIQTNNFFTSKIYDNGEKTNYLFETKRLSKEEKAEEKSDEEKLEKNQTSNKNSIQNNLENAVQIQLKQSSEELKKRIGSGAGAYYDNSAGFKTQGLNGISKQGQVGLISQSKRKINGK